MTDDSRPSHSPILLGNPPTLASTPYQKWNSIKWRTLRTNNGSSTQASAYKVVETIEKIQLGIKDSTVKYLLAELYKLIAALH